MKVHNNQMLNETSVKYLGDQVNNTDKIKATVEDRRSKDFGKTSEILSIANNVPLGQYRIKSGLLRQAMLVNGTLYNSECWQGTDVDKEILGLELPDQALIRGLVLRHSKVPLELLFLETGSVSVALIHACRRMIYLHSILEKIQRSWCLEFIRPRNLTACPGITLDF